MFNNDLFFPAVVSQKYLARVSFHYWTDVKNCFTYSRNMHTVLPRRLPEEVL